MLERIRYLFSNSTFICAEDGFLELFINRCKENNIKLQDVCIKDCKLIFRINDKDYKKVNDIGIETGMTVTMVKTYSMKAFIKKNINMIGLPIGAVCAAFIFWFLSGFLWSIEISGLNTVDAEEFAVLLEQAHIQKGIRLNTIDCNEIERYCESLSPEFLHVTVNLIGGKMFIRVQERELPPKKIENRYGNIIAAKNGRIIKINVFAGVPFVKENDIVCKGNMLVGGNQPLSDGTLRYYEAKADVYAETETIFQGVQNTDFTAECIEKIKTRYAIEFFGIRVPLLNNSDSQSYSFLSTRESVLPISLISEKMVSIKSRELSIDKNQQFLFILSSLADKTDGFSDVTEYTDISINHTNNSSFYEAVIKCVENISEPIYFETVPN